MLVNVCIRKDSASKHPFQNFSLCIFFSMGKVQKGFYFLQEIEICVGFCLYNSQLNWPLDKKKN